MKSAIKDDAAEMIAYLNKVSDETDNLTFNSKKFNFTVEEEVELLKFSKEWAILLLYYYCSVDGKIVGSLGFQANPRKRLRHCGSFGVSVLQEYWGLGIGTRLLDEMIANARKMGITKINLKVRDDNQKAMALYEKKGFFKEGRESRGMRINDEYIDFILMGLILD